MNIRMLRVIGSRHLSYRNLSVFNEFSKQLKGEAKSNPEFQKSIKEFSEKFTGVKEDLKVRTKKTADTIYKSVDDVLTEAEATSKKVTANVKEKMSAATEEMKESFRLGKEDTSSYRDGSRETSKTEYAKTSSHSDDKSQASTNGYTLFNKLRSTLSSGSPMVSDAFAKLRDTRVSTFAKQGYEIFKDELSSSGSRKKKIHARHASAATVEKSTRTDLVIVPTKRSVLGEKWEALKNKVAEDVRERWETSDNPVVQKIQDLNESIFEETATAVSFREIRQRDPSFSLPDFVADVQEMIKPVLIAYSKILHISDADVRETKMMGSVPIIIVVFQTQQIYCVRDREGQVTEGGQAHGNILMSSCTVSYVFQAYTINNGAIVVKDTIQTVFYGWAMQLMDSDEVPEEESYYPVWRLREIQQVGIKALI
uniref:Tim44-like domain-containing protein n=1 Tax=Leersia perrieri TaxID=77586 RepID=A0A0D9VLF6_9ORYZ